MKEKEDFEVFCYESEEGNICLEFGVLKFYRMINSLNQPEEAFSTDDDILMSHLIS